MKKKQFNKSLQLRKNTITSLSTKVYGGGVTVDNFTCPTNPWKDDFDIVVGKTMENCLFTIPIG